METTFRKALDLALGATGRSLRSIGVAANVSYEQMKNLTQGKAQSTNVDDAMKVGEPSG